MSKKVKIILLIVWVLSAIAYHCSHSKAEAATPDPALFPIPTFNPDPEAGYKDYLELMKTPEPTPCQRSYEEDFPPEYSPTPNPFDVDTTPSSGGVSTLDFSSLTLNQYFYTFNSSGQPVYTRGTGVFDSPPPDYTSFYTNDFGYYVRTNLFAVNRSFLNSSDSYFYQSIRFNGISNVPAGSSVRISNIWTSLRPYIMLPSPNGLLSAPVMQVNVRVTAVYQSGQYDYFDFLTDDSDLFNGSAWTVSLADALNYLYVEYFISYPVLPSEGSTYDTIYFESSNQQEYYALNALLVVPSPSDETIAINNQTSAIGRFFSNLINFITGLFIPDGDELLAFINSKVQSLESSPLGLAWSYGVRWLNILYAADDTLPVLRVPAYSISVNGSSYQLFSGFEVDFTTIPENLITYSHMIGDIILALAFVRYLGRKMVALFNIISPIM